MSTGMACHAAWGSCHRTSRLPGLLLSTFLNNISHKCSMGFKSGLWAATAGPRRESARGISSSCSLYGKEHCLARRQMLHPRHKVKKLKAACGSSAPSRIGPAAWCLHTGRVGRPLAQTCTPRPTGSPLRALLWGHCTVCNTSHQPPSAQ